MRRIDYSEWKARKMERVRKLAEIDSGFTGRAAGRRPRDPEKERLLTRMDKARLASYKASGKLEILAPRRWKWRIDRSLNKNGS